MEKCRVELLLTSEEKKFLATTGSGNIHTGIRIMIAFYKSLDEIVLHRT